MRGSKFVGGSKLVSFRLPLSDLEEVRAKINALIDSYAVGSGNAPTKPVKEVVKVNTKPKPIVSRVKRVEEVIETATPNAIERVNTAQSCSCNYVGTLFVRSKGCKIPREQHLPR